MSVTPLAQKVDAVQVPVPDLDTGLRFYHDGLGQGVAVAQRSDRPSRAADAGQRHGDRPDNRRKYEPNWLVSSADDAALAIQEAGGRW
jgi:hypothetical protein